MQPIHVELQANHHNSGLLGQATSTLELKLVWANWYNAHIFVEVNCVCVWRVPPNIMLNPNFTSLCKSRLHLQSVSFLFRKIMVIRPNSWAVKPDILKKEKS